MIDPSFQGVNRFFVLPYKNNALTTNQRRYFLPIVEIKHFNVMIDGRNFFDQPPYLWYKKICKLQVLHADSKLMQHIYFSRNLDWAGKKNNVFYFWKSNTNYFGFSRRNCMSIIILFLIYCNINTKDSI